MIRVGILLIAFFAIQGCATSSASITNVLMSNDKHAAHVKSIFAKSDTVFAHVLVGNNPGTVTIKANVTALGVPEASKTLLDETEQIAEVPGNGFCIYELQPPDDGWPEGKYQIRIKMYHSSGSILQEKAIEFTVSRASSADAPPPDR